MSVGANFLASGYAGQTTETLAIPTDPSRLERVVGVPLKAYVSLSWTSPDNREITQRNEVAGGPQPDSRFCQRAGLLSSVRAGACRSTMSCRSTIVTQARDMLPFTVYHAAAGCQFRALCGCMGLPWPAGFTCNWNLNARVLPQECEAPLRWGHSGMAGFERRDSQLSRQPA